MYSLHHLPNQQKNEKVIIFLRRHWLTFFHQIFFYLVLAIFPLIFYLITNDVAPEFFNNLPQRLFFYPFIVLSLSIYYLSILLLFFHGFIDYYLDVWLVTTQRIINIEQHGLFSRIVSEQKLDRLQDITSEVQGILPTLFHYGNIYIQTAGETQRFIFKQVPQPFEIRKKIIDLVENSRKNQ